MDSSLRKPHPRGLYVLFATEMWERFNYYGMRSILILFMTKALLFDKAFASNLYGSYTSLIFLSPLIGGYIADRYWGNSRSIITGGIIMALGELLLFCCGTFYQTNEQLSALLFFSGLGLMIAGNGFFKPNISSLVGQLYPENDYRKDSAYTLFYMGINTGGAIGPLVCGLVGETGDPADFRWSFLAAGIGMLISVIVQYFFQKKYVVDPKGRELGATPNAAPRKAFSPAVIVPGLVILCLVTIGLLYLDTIVLNSLFYLLIGSILLISFIIITDKTLNRQEKNKVGVIFLVSFFVIFFWSAFEQAGASLTFFADEQTDRFLGLTIPAWIIYLFSLALFYFIYWLFQRATKALAGQEHERLRITVYFLLFLFALAVAALDIYLLVNGSEPIVFGEIPASVFQSLNSTFVVLFAPFFAWLWIRLGKRNPSASTKMAWGLVFLGLGYLWIAFGVSRVSPGVKVSMIWLIVLYALHTVGELCLSPIGLSLVNKLSPLKFASLLMGIWFAAQAFANKLAGVLSSLYPQPGKPTNFLGYQMRDTYDFFMLFVVMSGTAALILFLISQKIQGMMKETPVEDNTNQAI